MADSLQKPPHPWLTPVIGLATLALTVAWIYLQIRHWKEPDADYMSMAISILVTAILWVLLISGLVHLRNSRRRHERVESFAVSNLWVHWSALADLYQRLDYDNRADNSTRLPFHQASWPEYGQPWSYVQAQLYHLSRHTTDLRGDTIDWLKVLKWEPSAPVPRVAEGVVMVDFLIDAREFQEYLNTQRHLYNSNTKSPDTHH